MERQTQERERDEIARREKDRELDAEGGGGAGQHFVEDEDVRRFEGARDALEAALTRNAT